MTHQRRIGHGVEFQQLGRGRVASGACAQEKITINTNQSINQSINQLIQPNRTPLKPNRCPKGRHRDVIAPFKEPVTCRSL